MAVHTHLFNLHPLLMHTFGRVLKDDYLRGESLNPTGLRNGLHLTLSIGFSLQNPYDKRHLVTVTL